MANQNKSLFAPSSFRFLFWQELFLSLRSFVPSPPLYMHSGEGPPAPKPSHRQRFHLSQTNNQVDNLSPLSFGRVVTQHWLFGPRLLLLVPRQQPRETRANKEELRKKKLLLFFVFLFCFLLSFWVWPARWSSIPVSPRNLSAVSPLFWLTRPIFLYLFWFYLGGAGALKRVRAFLFLFFPSSCVHWCSNQMMFKIGRGRRREKGEGKTAV